MKKNLLLSITFCIITIFTLSVNTNATALTQVSDTILQEAAQSNQTGTYNSDLYVPAPLAQNSYVFQLYSPNQNNSDFYTNRNTIYTAHSTTQLSKLLQVNVPLEWGPRQLIIVYKLKYNVTIASGTCLANTNYGAGGGTQYLIPKDCLTGPVGVLVYDKDNNSLACVYEKPGDDFINLFPNCEFITSPN